MNKRTRNTLLNATFAATMAALPIFAIADNSNRAEPSIEGTWVSKVVVSVSPPVSVLALQTFFPGGHAIEETTGSALRSVAQGEWERFGHRQFVRSMYIFAFDAPRTFTGMTKVVNTFELNHDGDEYDSIGNFEMYDTHGNLLATGQRLSHGIRCTAVTTVPHCMGIGE